MLLVWLDLDQGSTFTGIPFVQPFLFQLITRAYSQSTIQLLNVQVTKQLCENTWLPSSLVPRLSPQKRGRREPGNIPGKSCQLQSPCSGGTNQIAEQTTFTRDILSTQQKDCQLENELISVHYTQKVGEKQLSDVQKRRKSRESEINFAIVGSGTDSLTILCSSNFTCTKCVMELSASSYNTACASAW